MEFLLQAELLRVNCNNELVDAQKTLQDLEFHFMEERSIDSNELSNGRLSRMEMHETVNFLLPQVNQILIDCVRGKSIILPNAGDEKGLATWYTTYLGYLFNHRWSSTRRVLAQGSDGAPAPSPTVSSPSPAPSIPLASTQIHPPPLPFFSPDISNSDLQPTAGDGTSTSASDVQSAHRKTSKKTVVIAVVVTASVTFVLVALFFLFCRRCCRMGSGQGRNDERPLLSLSLSDYSIGMLHFRSFLGRNYLLASSH